MAGWKTARGKRPKSLLHLLGGVFIFLTTVAFSTAAALYSYPWIGLGVHNLAVILEETNTQTPTQTNTPFPSPSGTLETTLTATNTASSTFGSPTPMTSTATSSPTPTFPFFPTHTPTFPPAAPTPTATTISSPPPPTTPTLLPLPVVTYIYPKTQMSTDHIRAEAHPRDTWKASASIRRLMTGLLVCAGLTIVWVLLGGWFVFTQRQMH